MAAGPPPVTCQERGGGGQPLGLGRGAGPGRQKLCCWAEGWGGQAEEWWPQHPVMEALMLVGEGQRQEAEGETTG